MINIHIDFYYEETQIQSMICDIDNEIKSFEESKVDYYEAKSEDLNEHKIEYDRKSNLKKCRHQIYIFSFNSMKF